MTDDAAEDGTTEPTVPFISRVRLKNYKSIAECDVRLGPLAILVGPNGVGKSNFLDALAFMARALETTPTEALDERGGLREVLRRVPDRAESFTIAVDAIVPWWPTSSEYNATYQFTIGPHPSRGFEVVQEECIMQGRDGAARFKIHHGLGEIDSPQFSGKVRSSSDHLALQEISLPGPFRQLGEGLRRPRFYNFDTRVMRVPQPAASRAALERSGRGLGDVFAALVPDKLWTKSRIDAYLSAIMRNESTVEPLSIGEYTTIALKTHINGNEFEFGPLSMSDGTIRAVAVLAALFQPEAQDGRLPLLGIEEPEAALHPGAAGVLFDALTEAAEHVQVIATSQSADLLDREDLDVSAIRPVAMSDGLTVLGEVDDVSREIAREKLLTLGELMRGNQLLPRPSGETGREA